jgi:hypothetical protein
MALEDQTEAVFKTSRVDPVSGNDVPTGAMPEEVRDDIPAQLSEGEYVVPADVVRYYGVKFFEDLRSEAKMGWTDMERKGRVGGEPTGMEIIEPEDGLPFDISELETVDAQPAGFAEGGDVTFPSFEELTNQDVYTYVEYANKQGRTLLVPFFRGQPMSAIPEGYTPAGQQVKKATKTGKTGSVDNKESTPQHLMQAQDRIAQQPRAIDYASLSVDQLSKMVEDQTKFGMDDVVSTGAGLINPIFGLIIKGAMMAQAKQVERELERRLEDQSLTQEDRAALTNLLDVAQQDRPGLFSRLLTAFKGEDKEDVVSAEPSAVNAAVEEAMASYTPATTSVKSEPPTATYIPSYDIKTTTLVPGTGKTLDEILAQPVITPSATTAPKPAATGPVYSEAFMHETNDAAATARQLRDDLKRSQQKEAALDMAVAAPAKTAEVVARAERGLATPAEIKKIEEEGKRIEGALTARSHGASVGFSKGGLASKKKKK